ncbi:PREDICTED: tRNA (guanine(26)-N(2))-dimethyltransferase-like [Priapulus caudatus]|uniref:tRNA (guanine(26)-N(2))-dimethyltransferase n=1 Tax=Priapulus caudatus TaxID=37621 RepID=A0ABM1EFR2_PRICU|nr:PREDICTED: tRNA (guanine(26)-N(2))-dimethyltransferase-like [Priapulus caudatus]
MEQNDVSEDTFAPGKYWEDGITIFEGLSASGLRSIRFALELPGIKQVLSNDMSHEAVEYIKLNVGHNDVGHIVKPSQSDAAAYMYSYASKREREKFDVIDLDPYGSPAIFLDAAVQALKDGGLLCVTCTDTAVLCGNGAETCFAKYGGMSLKAKYCHEMALRLLLNSLESHAAQYSRYIVPVLCISADFYIRVFVRLFTSAKRTKSTASKRALVYHCTGCETFNLQHMGKVITTEQNNTLYKNSTGPPVTLTCRHCSNPHHIGGPMWVGPLYETGFLGRITEDVLDRWDAFKTAKRIFGMLTMMIEELPDAPLFYVLDKICSVVHVSAPKIVKFRSALLHAGFRVSGSHCNRGAIKTDAPSDAIWDIIRCLAKEEGKRTKAKPGSQAEAILNKEPLLKANFEKHPDAEPASKKKGLLRFQTNPEPDWGPRPKAKKRHADMSDITEGVEGVMKQDDGGEDMITKRLQNQGKKRKKKRQANPDALKRFPCKKMSRGECTLGESCRYSHDFDKVSRVKPAGTEQSGVKVVKNSDDLYGNKPHDYKDGMLAEDVSFQSDTPAYYKAF